MKKSRGIRLAAAADAFAALLFSGGSMIIPQVCTENSAPFVENFADASDLDEETSSVKFWFRDQSFPGEIMTLNKVGANFDLANPTYVPGWVNALTANDFDLDGWPDYIGTSSSYSNVLAFVRHLGGDGQPGTFRIASWIDGSAGDASDWPTRGVGGAAVDGEGHSAITSDDYDGDGDFDFLLVVSTTYGSCPIKRIWLYENTLILNGIRGSTLSFRRTDLTSAWSAAVKGIAWSSTTMVSVAFDSDDDVDIILGNKSGKILKITNTGSGRIDGQTFVVEPTPLISTGWGGRGVSTVSVADFDGAPGLDIIAGSVSAPELRFYKNDGLGNFTLAATISDGSGNLTNNLYDGAATVSLSSDFNRDGDQDFIVGTDNWNYGGAGYGGKCYYFKNDGSGHFTSKLVFDGPMKSPSVYDFDLGSVFDFDKDGDIDFMIADGNHSQYYYLFINVLANVYNTKGTGYSLNLSPTLSDRQYAITRVRIAGLDQSVLGSSSAGLSVEYFLSNNDGRNWESYARFEGAGIVNASNLPWHDFHTFGSSLRWKAVFGAAPDPMDEFDDASYETPVADTIRLEYVYVERREYSRSSAAAVTADIEGHRKKLIVSASFLFPGSEGRLRAYDVTGIAMVPASGSAIQLITAADPFRPEGRTVAAGGSIFWDAGLQLRDRSPASRTVYAGYRSSPGAPLQRLEFTTAQVGVLGPLLGDDDGDNAGLIEFVRGKGRDWKLGDILHSNPVIVGPPAGDSAVWGLEYQAFLESQAGRTSVVVIGANDGMLHCFETLTGGELWGFIPYNLLPKLKNMSRKDPETGGRSFSGDLYVDGTPAVGDAYIDGRWRTVLVCGQGAGKGSSIGGGLNYYFALDVTDPGNPLPLWETTQTNMGETWSVPAFGMIKQSSTDRWVAFVGSGYDNNPSQTAGNRFYVIRLDNGQVIRTVSVSNVNTASGSHPRSYPDISVAFPGSPTAVDVNRNGRTDYVYIGDLDGRLYRMDVTKTNPNNWDLTAIYTDRMDYPIITRPAVWSGSLTGGLPLHVFFGTGGDDAAPADRPYAFLALRDDGTSAVVEWYMGNAGELGQPSEARRGEFATGEKVWADLVIADRIVYFSTLKGSIEAVNPCENLADIGRLYGRFVESVNGSLIGGTSLRDGQGRRQDSLQLASKARKAVTIGERQKTPSTYKREVYIQEYNSTVERLEQPVNSLLTVVSWREVLNIRR